MALIKTADKYSPIDRISIVVYIKIKQGQDEWFILHYSNNTLKMERGPSHDGSVKQQDGSEL